MKSNWVCRERVRRRGPSIAVLICMVAALAGCTTSEPVAVPAASTFDRAWSAALSAAQEEGVRMTAEDRGSGGMRGGASEAEVTIMGRSQAEGRVCVEIGY